LSYALLIIVLFLSLLRHWQSNLQTYYCGEIKKSFFQEITQLNTIFLPNKQRSTTHKKKRTTMEQESTQKESIKLYSLKAISMATYLGGPLAAGILARRNFYNMGNEQAGKHAMVIGIISTLVIFGIIFSIPDAIIDKVPNALIPLIYTLVIYWVIEKTQGTQLKEHENNKQRFYSNWRAAGIGLACSLILLASIFTYAYYSADDNFDFEKYNQGITQLHANEEKALQLYTIMRNAPNEEVVEFIDKVGLPAWAKNKAIVQDLNQIEGLTENETKQNELLDQYIDLRIIYYNTIKNAILEETDKYNEQIQELNFKIDDVLKRL
jgi:hypothetical protein